MIIKGYGNIPPTYTPNVGDLVDARASVSSPFQRAVITAVRIRRHRKLEITVIWMETGVTGWIWVSADGWPQMIKQITKDQPFGQ